MTSKLVMVRANGAELVPGLSPERFASECREVGLSFLHGVANGRWGKRELAEWLLGPYARVSARPSTEMAEPSAAMGSGIVRVGAVEELVDLVRVAVSSSLGELQVDETSAITMSIRERAVSWARGGDSLVWVPIDHARMRLEARVMSLFAVDYLIRPSPYATELAVCASCDHVSFDGAGRQCERCNERGRKSDIRGSGGAPGILSAKKTAG